MNEWNASELDAMRAAFRAAEDQDEAGGEALRMLIQQRPESRASIVRFMALRAHLYWLYSSPQSAVQGFGGSLPVSRRRSFVQKNWFRWSAVAAVLGFCSLLWYSTSANHSLRMQLVTAVDSRLESGGAALSAEALSQFPVGKTLHVKGGYARIEVAGKASLFTRGDCSLRFLSPNRLYVEQGTVGVAIADHQEPLRISTPRGDLRQQDENVVVTVSRAGNTEVSPFRGGVEHRPPGDEATLAGAPPVDVTPEMNFPALVDLSRPAVRWNTESLATDVVHSREPSGRALADQPERVLIGNIKKVDAAPGPVLRLRGTPSGSFLRQNEPLPELTGETFTVEIAFQPNSRRHGTLLAVKHWTDQRVLPVDSLLIESAPWGFSHTHGLPADSIRVVYRSTPASDGPVSMFSPPHEFDPEAWYLAVVVKTVSTIQLWVNGKLSAEEKIAAPLPPHDYVVVGELLGTRDLGMSYGHDRPFQGDIAEVAVYDRALSPDEIALHTQVFLDDIRRRDNP
ncbi:LamG domain-containing protein [Planctomicrobium sp. SH664]|uniref:LamG domain-containing protein n=1 Tax=Planctomicrobium sp. SH664 TaxID=3448125 RepID=UPI003F5B5651